MRFLFIIVLTFSIFINLKSQCFDRNSAFTEGESLKYEVYYNWGLIWLNAGYVTFIVKQGSYKERKIYYFDAYGTSYKSYDWIFKVRDRYQCYFDKELLRPLWFHRVNSEGGFELDYQYKFDWNNDRVISHTENSERPSSIDTIGITACTFDLLSSIYYSRNIDFSNKNIGDSIPVRSFIDNESFDLYIRYLGKEVIETKEGKKYSCIKFSALLVEGTIFKDGEQLYGWVTDDENKIPVLVEAKILVGSVKTYLVQADGLLNEEKALVESEIIP